MPIYEYECENCGTRFDRLQSMQDEPVRLCPECSGKVHRVLHAAGLIFKGSGWYITDSRKSASSTVTGETKSATTESKTETKTDQPAKLTESKTETKVEVKKEKSETK